MHILYFHQHFSPPGGIGNNRSLEIAEHWVKSGCEVTIVCGSGNFYDKLPFYRILKTSYINGIRICRINVSYSHFFSFGKRIFSFFKFTILSIVFSFLWRKADLVYISSTPLTLGIVGIWFKRIFQKKFVFETVDLWPDVPVEMGIIKNRMPTRCLFLLEKLFYREAEFIVCLSEGMKDRILMKGIPENKITVAHNGTDCEKFAPVPFKEDYKKRIGIAPDKLLVLYAGTTGEANGLEFLVDVAAAIQKKTEAIQFLILGNGNRLKQISEYAALKKIRNLTFLPSVKKGEVNLYFNAADIGFVCFAPYPVLDTNSANKFFDYLASGLPVVINYGGWQQKYLQKYNCGFSGKSVNQVADYLIEMGSDPEKRSEQGENARKLAEEYFDRSKISQIILSKLNSLKVN